MTIEPDFYASDLHFGHVNIIKFCDRPFEDVPHMNEMLVEMWNETVSQADSVEIEGDLCMGVISESIKYVERLNGLKYLRPGNHDRIHSSYQGKKYDQMLAMYEDAGLTILPETEVRDFGGHQVTFCHFPYTGDHTEEERYSEYRPVDEGNWLIHGHIHDLYKIRGRCINVGIDVWDYRPVSRQTLLDIINS